MIPGKVFIVGAGPGDVELITVKGLRALQRADVVVYDRLVNQQLLNEASPWAELVYVGKEPGRPSVSQAVIEAFLLERAQAGKYVVRLKGGDPFVFGRGGEECQTLAENGIPFEVIPGISSALAAPAYAGIPVTQRRVAQSFTVVTGHTAGSDGCAVDWEALPRSGTLVVLMGVQNLPVIAEQLVAHGRASETPAAVIEQGTTAAQKVVTGTLATIADRAKEAAVRAPAVIVVGGVVGLAQEIGWFSPEMLAGDPLSEFLTNQEGKVDHAEHVY